MARCLLLEAKLSKDLWTYDVLSASYIPNRCYNGRLSKTPFEAFTGTKPDIKNMNIFGTSCNAYVQDKEKLDPRAKKGTFVGYDKYSPAYFVYFKESKNIKRVRCVTFTNKFEDKDKIPRMISYDNDDGDYHSTIKPVTQREGLEECSIEQNENSTDCAINQEDDAASSS